MTPRNRQHEKRRGSSIIEMAFMLPVLILLFVGMVEFGQFITMRERINKVTNQLTGVLYNVSVQDVSDINVLEKIISQAPALAAPLRDPTITIRFCEWKNGRLYRVNRQMRSGNSAMCKDEGPKCSVEATQSGFGSFVQVYGCSTFTPILTEGLFSVFNAQLEVKSLSYLPLMNPNTDALGRLPGGGEPVAESSNCATDPTVCGGGNDTKQCPPGTEDVNNTCKPFCDTGFRRNADGSCPCATGKVADGSGGCKCPGNTEWIGEACRAPCPNSCDYRSQTSPYECMPKPNC